MLLGLKYIGGFKPMSDSREKGWGLLCLIKLSISICYDYFYAGLRGEVWKIFQFTLIMRARDAGLGKMRDEWYSKNAQFKLFDIFKKCATLIASVIIMILMIIQDVIFKPQQFYEDCKMSLNSWYLSQASYLFSDDKSQEFGAPDHGVSAHVLVWNPLEKPVLKKV